MVKSILRFAAICGLLAWGAVVLAQEQIVIEPEETDEILANPGIGWETFHHTSKQDKSLPKWIPSTIHYARWGWGELEPQPGKLNTAFLDKVLKDTHDSGQKLAFRVMCCSTYKGHPYHPKWCSKELQADYEGQGPLPIPDMDDPVVLNAHLDFIKRLGKKYDGHPDVDHIDLGSIGWWGEWHLSGQTRFKLPTLENRKKVVDAYLAAFKKTPLLMLIGGGDCLKYACADGTGWRADCLGDMGGFSRTWCHMRNAYPLAIAQVSDTWKTAPVAFETCWDMRKWVNDGWSLRYIFNYALACHASVINNKSAPLPNRADVRPEIERFLRRLGYRFILKELRHPAQVQAGGKIDLSMKWQNVGSARCYKPYRVAYRFSHANGFSKVIVSKTTVNSWLPGTIEMFTPDFFKMPKDLPNGEINEVADTISLAAIPTGQYTLAIGIVEDKAPVVRLGIKGRTDDGWYPLSKIEVVNLEAVESHMAAHTDPAAKQQGAERHPKSERPVLVMTWFQDDCISALFYHVSQKGEWFSVLNVYNHAHQDAQSGKLSDSHLSNLRTLLPKLPKSAANKPPISRFVVISFERDGKWCTETYDSSHLPDALEKVMLIVGERFETKDRKREPNAKAVK